MFNILFAWNNITFHLFYVDYFIILCIFLSIGLIIVFYILYLLFAGLLGGSFPIPVKLIIILYLFSVFTRL